MLRKKTSPSLMTNTVIAFSRIALGSETADELRARSTANSWCEIEPYTIITTMQTMIAAPRMGQKSIVAHTLVLRFRIRVFAVWLGSNGSLRDVQVSSRHLDTAQQSKFLSQTLPFRLYHLS